MTLSFSGTAKSHKKSSSALIVPSTSCATARPSPFSSTDRSFGTNFTATLRMMAQNFMCKICIDLKLFSNHSYGQTKILHYQTFHLFDNSCISRGLRPPRTLAILYRGAITFESVKPLLKLCNIQNIVSKHLRNLTNG
ncbi:hypothetical protein TNCV_4306791 [Trichonephila clavipes]|nr:hypothetical protein TNCV_4306791 [Trichonephila clavipes]